MFCCLTYVLLIDFYLQVLSLKKFISLEKKVILLNLGAFHEKNYLMPQTQANLFVKLFIVFNKIKIILHLKNKYNFLIQIHLILLLSSNSYFGGTNISGDSLFFSHCPRGAGWYIHKPPDNNLHPQAVVVSLTRGDLYSHCPRSSCVHRLNLIHLNMGQNVLLVGTYPSLPLQALPQRELA